MAPLAVDRELLDHLVRSVMPAEAANVGRSQIVRRLAVGNPVRHRLARTAARRDAETVEAASEEEITKLGRFAHDRHAVLRKGFQPVDEPLDPDLGKRRDAHDGGIDRQGEMVQFRFEEMECVVLGNG